MLVVTGYREEIWEMGIRKVLVPEIMQDLMVLYPADEASPATRAVETCAQQNKEFAALLRRSGASPGDGGGEPDDRSRGLGVVLGGRAPSG